MNESSSKGRLIRLILFAALAAGLFFLWRSSNSPIAKLFAMVFGVLLCETVLALILGLFKPQAHRARTILSITVSLLKYVAAIVILCWGLAILGVDITAIVASVGILTLVVGFGAESLIADVITGTFMPFENQYNVGDFVEVGGFRGKVTSIGIRTTCLEDAGGNVKIINNSDMNNILNRSDHTSRAVSVIGIPYETDLEALEAKMPEMLAGMYQRHQDMFLAPPVYLGVDELADSSVNLKFVVEVHDASIYSASRALNRELFLCMRKVGVEVPFPQVDVHQK